MEFSPLHAEFKMFHIWFSWDVEEFPSPEELPLHSSAKHSLYCFILCRKNSICFSDSSLSQLSHTGAANMEQAVGQKEETSSKQVIAMDVTHCNLLWDPNPWFTVSLPTALHCQGADTLSLFSHLEYASDCTEELEPVTDAEADWDRARRALSTGVKWHA